MDRAGLEDILWEFKIGGVEKIKFEILNLLLLYVSLILKDFNISEGEQRNMTLLKKLFKIREGDFFQYRQKEIRSIISQQLESMYSDGIVRFG